MNRRTDLVFDEFILFFLTYDDVLGHVASVCFSHAEAKKASSKEAEVKKLRSRVVSKGTRSSS